MTGLAQTTANNDKALLGRASLAPATITLLAGALAAWGLSVVGGITGVLPTPLAVVLAATAAYVSFTPMHDASHRALGRSSLLNEVVGRLAGLPLFGPFPAFRYVHLEHHKHTNETDGTDPDRYSGNGPAWTLPLRWATQDLHYYVVYLARIRTRPRAEVAEVLGAMVTYYGSLIALMAAGYAHEVVLFVIVPARIGIFLLSLAFDYLPHVPYLATRRENRYLATRILDHSWLTPLMLGQNYHLVHHLYPAVPWYRYGAVWHARRADLEAKGARASRLRPVSRRARSAPAGHVDEGSTLGLATARQADRDQQGDVDRQAVGAGVERPRA